MHFSGLVLSAAMALTAVAVPLESRHAHLHAKRQLSAGSAATTFPLHIVNLCPTDKQFALFQITSDWATVAVGPSKTINSGESATIQAPFQETGLRLTGNGQLPLEEQITTGQPLFEFGYAQGWAGVESGTAYDISMINSDLTEGISVTVLNNGNGSDQCESKFCVEGNCPVSQAWTSEDQNSIGSPADTVCYHGPAAITVTWCPTS